MIRPWGVIAIAGLIGWADLPAQVPRCESAAPTDAQIARGRSAITVARQINTAEAQLWPTTKRYAPLTELTGITVPEGFEVQVSTDGATYTFSVKDLQDACKFAVFSDQNGLIYTAAPLQ